MNKIILLTILWLGIFNLTPPLDNLHCLGGVMAMQQEPGQGNPDHREPPPGWTCNVEGEHKCSCHRECVDEVGEGETEPHTIVREDPKCSSYCYPKHCNCPLTNCP